MKNKELAIIIYSCDRNNSMWDIVKLFFDKYWKDCPYSIVLLTDYDNTHKGEALGFDEVIECDSDWSTMMKTALERLQVPYFITWMDDFLLCDYVSNEEVEKKVNLLKEKKAINLRLMNSNLYQLQDTDSKSVGALIPGTAYSFSTHAGIWETEGFLKVIKLGQSAWDFERKGSMTNKGLRQPILVSRDYNLPYIECVRKGKWFPEGVALLKRNNIDVNQTNKAIMSNWDMTKVYLKGAILEINPDIVLKIQNLKDNLLHRNRKTY